MLKARTPESPSLCSLQQNYSVRTCMYQTIRMLVSLVILLGPSSVVAQQDTNEETNSLEEIVVTATRVPTPLSDTLSTTEIITAEEIERTKPRDLGDLLRRKSGIGFRDSGGRGSSGGLFVRGTSTDQTLILIDGIRTASATQGATSIERIPLDSIERIEIIKGPMSSVYGAAAIGGVIQIFTKQYGDKGTFGTVKTTAGTNNFKKHNARVGYSEEAYSFSASVLKESTDGIDRTEFKDDGNEDRDGFEQTAGNFSLSLDPLDNLAVNFAHVQSSSRFDYDNVYGNGKNLYAQAKLTTSSVRFEYEQSESTNFTGVFGTTKDHYTDYVPDSSPEHFNTNKSDLSVQVNLILSAQNQVSFGVDYQNDKIDSTNSYQETKRTNKGFFALWQYQGIHSSTVLNGRHDHNSAFGSNSNYGLQQSFDLNDEYKIVTSYGTAFKAPTFNDLFWPKKEYSWGTYQGNPDLEPEKSKSFEISLRAGSDKLNWQINAFQTKIIDLIGTQTIDTVSQPTNIKKSTQRGVEVELTKEWKDYIFNSSLDYLEAKDDESGEFLDGRARSSASFEFGKQMNNLYVGIDVFGERGRYDRGKKLPSYALWGISSEYNYGDRLFISGHIKNLFDKQYVTNLASPNSAYQNEGRTFQLSVEYKF